MSEETERMYNIHLYLLKKYSKIFNESIFCISMDNVDDIDTLNKVRKDIINAGYYSNVKILLRNNSIYREGKTFYDEIASKLSEMDGITFFAHSKGFSNVSGKTLWGYDISVEAVYKWVTFMYYMCLNDIDLIRNSLYGDNGICYGTFCMNSTKIKNRNNWFYGGSFFWVNTKKLHNYMYNNNIELPLLCDRTYAEQFLGNIINYDMDLIWTEGLKWHRVISNLYDDNEIERTISFLIEHNPQKVEEYNKLHNYIIENI